MPFSAQGNSGSLRVGGRVAADLGRWSLRALDVSAGGGYEITAPLVGPDHYWLAQGGPFELRLALSRCVWRWRDVLPTLDATTLTARVQSPPEEL